MLPENSTNILIIGGGVAAALAALRLGQRVILTEETDWIGGQLTSQAVPPDEHLWIGCYRLHPVEWNIGEAAGALAAYCLAHRLTPRQVHHNGAHLADFQRMLTDTLGFVLAWPEWARVVAR